MMMNSKQMQFDEHRKYLNTETGEIIDVSTYEMRIVEESEEDDNFSEYPDWQKKDILQALDIEINWGNSKYIELPTKYDIHEYSIMEEFCESVSDERISKALYSTIRGRGAFRRFKDAIYKYNVEDSWYKFREEAFKEIAIEWCENNHIPFI